MTPEDCWYEGFLNGLMYAQAQHPGRLFLKPRGHDVLTITAPADDTFGPPNPDVNPMKPQPTYTLPFKPRKMWEALDRIDDEAHIADLRIEREGHWWTIQLACTEGMGVPDWFHSNRKDYV